MVTKHICRTWAKFSRTAVNSITALKHKHMKELKITVFVGFNNSLFNEESRSEIKRPSKKVHIDLSKGPLNTKFACYTLKCIALIK